MRPHTGKPIMRGLGTGCTLRRLATMAAILALTGCSDWIDSLVEVKPRDQIDPGALANAEGAKALYNGALNNISVAFSGNNGGTEGIAIIGGTMGDEFTATGTFSTRESYDRRGEEATNGTVGGVLRNLHDARHSAIRAHAALVESSTAPGTDSRISEMKAIEGLTWILGAETFCNGLPFSTVEGATITGGPPLTNADAFASAVDILDEALSGAPGTGNVIANLAKVLKARALMDLGKSNFAAAAALVTGVPNSFQYFVYHSTNGNRNGIFVFNTQNERFSLAHLEGGNGMPFRGAGNGTDPSLADPRIPWERDPVNGWGFDGVGRYPQYNVQKWLTFDDDVVVASGVEARLIEAEADLAAGNATAMLTKLNALRQTVAGLADLTDPGTATGREDLLFKERAMWLYGEAHRLGDLRRLIRQYGRAANSIFPTGAYHKGGTYADDVNFPINDVEENNAAYREAKTAGQLNVRGCLDNNA